MGRKPKLVLSKIIKQHCPCTSKLQATLNFVSLRSAGPYGCLMLFFHCFHIHSPKHSCSIKPVFSANVFNCKNCIYNIYSMHLVHIHLPSPAPLHSQHVSNIPPTSCLLKQSTKCNQCCPYIHVYGARHQSIEN